MITIITTLDLQRNTTAYLENAYNIGYEKVSNQIWSASFSLPINDPKAKKVQLLRYVEIDDVGLFRIIPKRTSKSGNEISFECEHVLATLLNSTLFKYHQLTNYTTREVLQYLINQQKEKHWRLGTVAFTRYFHYSWENENLLAALFSVPKPFDEQYRWTWDTSSYPWTLSLVKPEAEPTARIKERHNLIDLTIEENPMSMYNRIYPLGAGEGVNQLGIESVNGGIPYIEDAASIAENGLLETVWADKRFEDAASLKASAQALLKKWKEPIVNWTVSAADVSQITGSSIDELKEGKVVRLELDDYPVTDLRIMKESKSDMIGDPGNVELEIGNLTEDLGTTQADMERRQKVNELNSQGSTSIFNFGYQDNADSNIPALIPFYVDDDVVNINTCELTFRTNKYRTYAKAVLGGGSIVESTSSGGGTTRSTTSGGGTTRSTTSGGGTTQTSSSGGGTSTSTQSGGGSSVTSGSKGFTGTLTTTFPFEGGGGVEDLHTHNVNLANSQLEHNHSVSVPAHSHSFSTPNHTHTINIPSHSHEVTIPAHSHDVTIPAHTHDITLPNHTHDVKHEIIELNNTPSSVTIKVDGNTVPHTSTTGDRIDLIDYMEKDDSGKVTRGRHEVTIHPNGLARIEADLILRVFIQSRLGGIY